MQLALWTKQQRTAGNRIGTSLGMLLALVLFLMIPATRLFAQYDTGSVLGEIHDATGAVLPGTTVTAVNKDTGVTSTAVTGDAGQYEIPSLRTGKYKITATHAGFSTAIADNITVSVGVRQRIALTLQVGEANATTIEVSDVALQLNTESSERGQTVTGYQTEAFPLVGRNYSDLLGLVVGARQAPTAATTSSVSSLLRQGAYNVNGQRSMFNNFMLDGMDNNAYGESNQGFDNQIISVPPDSVAQWNVVTNNENAEYGRASGATINVATASGTNRFHTTLYEFVRNTDLNAAGFFKPTLSGTNGLIPFQKPILHRNQFGANFGGPIVKEKLFYFVDYEGLRATLSPLYSMTLPTQNELNGILTVPVTNPLTGTAYAAGTAIPSSAINPLSSKVLNYFKTFSNQLPVSGSATTGLATYDYAREVPFTDKFDKGDLRLDYHQDANDSWFLRVSDRKETGVNNPIIPLPLDGQTNGTIRVLDQQVALGYTRLLGPNKVLDARLGLSRTKAGKWTLSIGSQNFNIPGLPTDSSIAGGLPAIGIGGGFTGFGRLTSSPQWQNPAVLDPKVNFTWLRGHHSLKFGYEYEHVWMAVNDNNPLYGQYTFGGHYSNSSSTAADAYWADFLFGLTSTYQQANYYVAHLEQALDSAYAQDDWKVTPKLTLNLGLRWEYGSPYWDLHNNVSNFDPVTQTVLTTTANSSGITGITPVSAGGVYGKTLVNPDFTDFMPRVGFAYNMLPKTVVRGGFGTGFIHYTRAGSGDILAINAPQAQFASVLQPTPTTSNHCNPLPAQIITTGTTAPSCYATIDQGFPSGLVTAFNPATDNVTWINKNRKDAYVENAFLSIEQQLYKNTVLDVAYVFNHGVHLEGFINGNQKVPTNGFARPYANWPSDITEALNEFSSNFNALQVKYEQRFVGGLTLLNSFTWEHSLDNASASLEGNTPSVQDGNNISADYGQSDYNLPVANVTSLVYELPVGHGRRFLSSASTLLNTLIGDWQVSAINTMQAGTPFNITYGPGTAQAVSPQITNSYRGANLYRPYKVPGVPVTQGRSSRTAGTGYVNYVNLNAFVLQPAKDAAGHILSPFGTASRNPGRTPAYYNTDFDLVKKFNTPLKNAKIEFRAEAYNLFNHTNLYLPGTISGTQGTTTSTLSTGASAALGQITGGVPTGGGQITSTFQPRVLQFGLKVIY
ncbi:MAG: TonB-dependent receptor [Terracidiphilus sp.]|nr:TonB-dependent receptor [Terracidiphilus sp.]